MVKNNATSLLSLVEVIAVITDCLVTLDLMF
jgi:hypothetical protein